MDQASTRHTQFAPLIARALPAVLASLLAVSSGCQNRAAIDARSLPPAYNIGSASYKPPVDWSQLGRIAIDNRLIYPGDVLDVTLVTGAEEKPAEPLPYRVNAQGELDLPLIGPVPVVGVTLTEAERRIREASVERRIFRNPQVTVLLNSRQMDRVEVVGAVLKPGSYELPAASNDLLAAIVAAGGPDVENVGTRIVVRHPMGARSDGRQVAFGGESAQPNVVDVDLVALMQGGDVGDLRLRDGSRVHVEERIPEKVYVAGLVKQAGAYDIPKDEPLRVTQAIAKAGGRTLELADTVYVSRYIPDQDEKVVIEVSLAAADADTEADLVLAPNDVVTVKETPLTFFVETMRNFFRFGFSSAIPGT